MQCFRVSKQWYGCQCSGFNERVDVDACDCKRGLCEHCKRICTETELTLGENPLPHRGLEPAPVLRLAFQSDALPAELSRLEFSCAVGLRIVSLWSGTPESARERGNALGNTQRSSRRARMRRRNHQQQEQRQLQRQPRKGQEHQNQGEEKGKKTSTARATTATTPTT